MTAVTTAQSHHFNPLIDVTPLNLVLNAYRTHDFDQAIDYSNDAAIHVQLRELVSVLDLRAKAFGMKGQFTKAVAVAEEIVQYAPTSVVGYFRLGQLFSMQGKQSAAIQAYQDALKKAKQEDDPERYAELVQEIKNAKEKKKARLDIMMMLPLEIVDFIFEYLSESNKLTCLKVSIGWRNRLLYCSLTWSTIYNNYYYYNDAGASDVLHIMPHVAKHVKSLRVNTGSRAIGRSYLEHFENGDFKKIKTLELTAATVYTLTSMNSVMSFSNALWQTRNTLTKLVMTFTNHSLYIHITDFLFYLPHLKTLVLFTYTSLNSIMGNMEYLGGPHLALEDVEIESCYTTGNSLRPLLEYCPSIRRLCLKGCDPCVLDVVDEICNENLQIFSYNSRIQEKPLEEMDKECNHSPPGLQQIYTPNGGCGVPTESLLRLIYKNQKSLQTVHANLSMTEDQEENKEPYPNLHPTYNQWYFERIQHLTYWPDIYNVAESMFLKSIVYCNSTTPLKLFSVTDSPNLPMIIDTLMDMSPVEKLKFSHMEFNDGENGQRSAALIRLLQYYSSVPAKEQKLQSIWFEYCNFITDKVLLTVIQLKSLRTIQISGNCTVPSQETLNGFLDKVKDRIVEIKLADISYVDDDVLDVLGTMEYLQVVTLEGIQWITEYGIRNLVDDAKSLHTLAMNECTDLSEDTMCYVKRKIKHFKILDEYEG